ncbi:ribonuclease HII [Aquibacillus salsiterrae]|uniref:Ribonuclease HII n=1 Tax=Aquibacillus salsiterrae TaxID=2950439 RepID=A0A9X3WBS9_9BACI|nr:ribonuclease HII [Aquibacillus salsiterrae]MDC3416412.1 ribonuclease HII [Aquibacillus salsiterrae]
MWKERTIADIKKALLSQTLPVNEINELKSDTRIGVQKLVTQYEKMREKKEQEHTRFLDMMQFEQAQYEIGNIYVAGIDEAGRGPLAGPVVAAAVILPQDFYLAGLNDSKQIRQVQREKFYDEITRQAVSYGISMIHNDEIDAINIYQATKKTMKKAIQLLDPTPDHVLIDAVPLDDLPCTSKSIVKGDQLSVSIAAASILAKVTRDRWMAEIDQVYPVYHFASNKGYGTKDHLDAIEQFGICPYHRTSFEPIHTLTKR